MSKYEKSTRHGHRESDRYERSERENRKERDSRQRRHRSPSYDSYDDSSDYDSESTRDPSPRRPSRRHTTAHSDGEGRSRRGRDRQRRARDYDDSDSSPERRSIVEDLLSAVGLVQSKNKDKGHRGERSRGVDDDEKRNNTRQAVQAALTAAAMEAFRTRKEGKLTPQRLMQIAGAAIAAGGLDAIVDRSGGSGGSVKHLIESIVAGLATGKTLGGKVKHKRDESMGNKVGSGMLGMATKKLLSRSMSRGPDRRRTNRF